MLHVCGLVIPEQLFIGREFTQLTDIQSVLAVNTSGDVADRFYFCAVFGKYLRRITAYVAEALNCKRYFVQLFSVLFQNKRRRKHYAAARSGNAPFRPAQLYGLSRHHPRTGFTVEHAVGIQYPRHRLRVGVDVGRGDILIGAYNRFDRIRITAGQTAKLPLRQL